MAASGRLVNGGEVPGCVVKEIEKRLYKTLKDVFGYDSYRSLVQKRAVEAVANSSQDVFVSMPTGAGKSLCYQLPALVSERQGITIVVSPLIALMMNQIEQMRNIGVCTETINSKMSSSERERVKADLISPNPKVKLLYITPELANTSGFNFLIDHLYNNNNIARIVVDEAHCVSQWGHNFRPDYLRLGDLKEKYPLVPWVALTATASVKVMDDILLQLKFSGPVAIFKTSCYRPNLFYDVVFKELIDDPHEDLKEFALHALGERWEVLPPNERGCGIVYCRTRDACEEIALKLTKLGLRCQAYHAGLKPNTRKEIQTNWMEGRTPVISATVSFGMGIDKPTVRFVAHWCVSQSLAGYYQESGRAGRDGEPASCRIYYSQKDRDAIMFLLKKDEKSAPSKAGRIKAAAAVKSFDSVVKYCEELNCRHYLLSREFGDDIPDCKKCCDVCTKPKIMEHKLQLFRSMKLGSKIEQLKSSKIGLGECHDLYGSGRKGTRDDTDAYYDDGGDDDEARERKEGKALKELIHKEFEKRRGIREKNAKLEATSLKVLEPSLKKIHGLSLEAREKIHDKLVEEITGNLTACRSNPACPKLSSAQVRRCAADYELDAFKTKGNIHVYRKDFGQLFKSLQEATRQVEVHPITCRYMQKSGTGSCASLTKDRLRARDCKSSAVRSSISEHFVNSSQSCSSPKTDNSFSNFSDAYEGTKRKRALSNDSQQSGGMIDLNDISNSPSQYSDAGSPRKMIRSCASDTSKTVISDKPMIKYFFESVSNCPSGPSPELCNDMISPKSGGTSDRFEPTTSHGLGSSRRQSVSKDASHSPRKQKKSEITVRVKGQSPEKPKKEMVKTTSQIQNDNLKKAADLVRKHLNPQYKAKKISKDLFKIVCRSISHRLVEANAVNDRAAKYEVEKLFQQYSVLEGSSASVSF